jgi:hypothetical protein
MSKLIAISIDVTKLDKSKFVVGKKGTYANLTVSLNDEADQYGNNCSVWQSQSQEEREAKQDRNFLGNGKVVFDGDSKAPQQSRPAVKHEAFEDGLPF